MFKPWEYQNQNHEIGENRPAVDKNSTNNTGNVTPTHDEKLLSKKIEALYLREAERICKLLPVSLKEMIEVKPEIEIRVEAAEQRLNKIWTGCQKGEGKLEEFKEVLSWYGEVMKECVDLYKAATASKK